MKQVYINVAEEINRILPENLQKDLTESERICPVCHGLTVGNNYCPKCGSKLVK